MISVENISLQFVGRPIFDGVSFLISPGEKIGLVGKNGAGKSTLLKIILGQQQTDSGNVSKPGDLTIGYLPQQLKLTSNQTVFEEAKNAFLPLLTLQAEIDAMGHEMASRTDYDSESYLKLLDRFNEKSERYQILGGQNMEAEIEKILMGLGFERTDFPRHLSEFSGGWRMRVELAKILLQQPDVLLLDEPTNHLDIESIQWLEDFLKTFKGALVLISHDRAFLDAVTTRTMEITLSKVHDYDAPFSKYVEQRRERREQQLAAYQNQQKMIEDTEKFIERFRYKATKAVQVQSRIKQLEKLDRIEVEEEDRAAINIRFPEGPRAGSITVEAENLSKRYGDHLVLHNIDFEIERGERIAFIGRNGEGKTTLSKIIVGDLDYTGKLKLGNNVNIGYFAQNQDELLDGKKTVFETLDDIAVGDIRTKIRDILGAFMFSGEDADKKVSVLSGGEKSRLAMAKLLLEPYNLLVLDEPTNHLDIQSKDILKQALMNFTGTIILVSHDREFLNNLTHRIYEFRDKKIKEHRVGIYDILKQKKIGSLAELDLEKTSQKQGKVEDKKASGKRQYEDRKKLDREIRRVSKLVETAEKEIHDLEEKIARMDELLANPGTAHENLTQEGFYDEYNAAKTQLQEKMEAWEQHLMELETLKNERI